MSYGNELPKVIDRSQADIDAAIAAVQSCDLPSATKDFAISCIRLAVWLPKALLEHKIKLSNLRKLIFGQAKKNLRKTNNENTIAREKPESKSPTDGDATPLQPPEKEIATVTNRTELPGHGRLPHSAYKNTIEHTLAISELKSGDLCPEHCGGRLYHNEPGILVRVKGQNLAAVHKYWVEKLRCASCGHLVSASIPNHVGKEKYDAAFKAISI